MTMEEVILEQDPKRNRLIEINQLLNISTRLLLFIYLYQIKLYLFIPYILSFFLWEQPVALLVSAPDAAAPASPSSPSSSRLPKTRTAVPNVASVVIDAAKMISTVAKDAVAIATETCV